MSVHTKAASFLLEQWFVLLFVLYFLIRSIPVYIPWWLVQVPILGAILIISTGITLLGVWLDRDEGVKLFKWRFAWIEVFMLLNGAVATLAAFGAFTFALFEAGTLELGTSAESAETTVDTVISLFAWNLFDVIPVIDINETIQWDKPIESYGTGVGFLLLAFKALILVSVVRALATTIRGWLAPPEQTTNRAHRPSSSHARAPRPPAISENLGREALRAALRP